jgi:hypothetical protein
MRIIMIDLKSIWTRLRVLPGRLRLAPGQMPPPAAIVDLPKGAFVPAMFWYRGEASTWGDLKRIAATHDLYLRRSLMQDELDDDHPTARHYIDGDSDLTPWQPAPPGPEFLLLGKLDTEEGPLAIWARPLTRLDIEQDTDLQARVALPEQTRILSRAGRHLTIELPTERLALGIARRFGSHA